MPDIQRPEQCAADSWPERRPSALDRVGFGAWEGLRWGGCAGAITGAVCAIPLGLLACAYGGAVAFGVVLLLGAAAGTLLGAASSAAAAAAGAALGSTLLGMLLGSASAACGAGLPLYLASEIPQTTARLEEWEEELRTRASESGRAEAIAQTASLRDSLNFEYGLCFLGASAGVIAGGVGGCVATRRALKRRGE